MATSSMTAKLFGHDVSASKTMKDVGKVSAGVAGGIGAPGLHPNRRLRQILHAAVRGLGQTTLKLQQRYMVDPPRTPPASRTRSHVMTGVDSDTASKGLGILSHLAANDKAAKSLGISFQDSSGKVKPMNDFLPQIAEKFRTCRTGAEKSALAMKLFGKNGMAMLPFLNKGSAGIQNSWRIGRARHHPQWKDLDAVKEYTKAKRQWSEAIKGVQVSLGKNLYPVLTSLANKLLPADPAETPADGQAPLRATSDPSSTRTGRRSNPPSTTSAKRLSAPGKWIGDFSGSSSTNSRPQSKELIAMLAIAQRPASLSIAFKGLDLAKTCCPKSGMAVCSRQSQRERHRRHPKADQTDPNGRKSKTGHHQSHPSSVGSPLLVVRLCCCAVAGKDLSSPSSSATQLQDRPRRLVQKNTFGGAEAS